MNPYLTNTQNPKYLQFQKEYAHLRDTFGARNPYLFGLIDRARNTRPLGDRRFGYVEVNQIVKLLDETGYTDKLHNDADMQDPSIFWNIMNLAKKYQKRDENDRAIRALVFLYENLDKKGTLGDEFKRAPKSPYPFIRKRSFIDMLRNDYEVSDNVFIINYSQTHKPLLLNINYKNKDLRSIVIDTFIKDQSKYTISHDDAKELCYIEDVFGPYADKIHSLEDLNTEILTYAKDYILEKYADNERIRIKLMKHLWCIFRNAVLTYPDKEFFSNSHLWNSIVIMNHRAPILIAKGYVPVIIESYGSIPAYEKVMYIYTNGEFFGANGVCYGVFSVDFSSIKTELYRWLAINFTACTDQRKHPIVTGFLRWLEQRKAQPGYKYSRQNWVYADELYSYKNVISLLTRNNSSRNAYMAVIICFLRWAAGTQKLHLQKGVFKYFTSFKHRYIPKPRSLTTCNKKAIEESFLDLAEKRNEPRFLLIMKLFEILLRSDIRAGQLCALSLDRMTWNEDGTSSYLSRVKNRGESMVKTNFTKRCTELLLEAKALTEDIRRECPVEGPKDCLFLYRGIRDVDDPISVMDLQRFNMDLSQACKNANIPNITTGNIRDTRQTAVARFAHWHNLNDAQIATLTKHACRTSLNSYVDLHIEDMLYAVDDITLGTINTEE